MMGQGEFYETGVYKMNQDTVLLKNIFIQGQKKYIPLSLGIVHCSFFFTWSSH